MAQTIAEKILSAHCGRQVKAGDIAICDVDFCFGQDGTSSLIIESLNKLGARSIFAPDKFCMVIDHSAPSPNQDISAIHALMRSFAKEKNTHLYDIGCGVCHQLIPESGRIIPGDLVIGADSHTSTYGALNMLATGVGSTDLAIAAASGKNWFRVPETVKILVNGKLPKGVFSKDIILYIIGSLGAGGCTYKSVEFEGQAIRELSVDARFTICNMAVEMGAKFGVMQADKKVIAWFGKLANRPVRKPNPAVSDADAVFCDVKEYDVSKLEPQAAKPHTVDNVSPVSELKDIRINEAYLGTCTNGRLEDFEIASKVLGRRKLNSCVKFIVAPASRDIFLKAIKSGIIKQFVEAGAVVVSPGCGPCVGTHEGIPADNEIVISTANRNFKGRMGNPNALIYLASPATVTASAIEGKIADPRRYL